MKKKEQGMNCKQAGELMISKGWEYDPSRKAYCMKANGYGTWIPIEIIEEYVRDYYPKEYAEMSLKNDVSSLFSRVSALEQKDFMSGKLGEPYKGRALQEIHYKLEDGIKSLQVKCRGLDEDLAQQRKSASSFIKTCQSKIKDLEHELAEEKQMAWDARYGENQVQNVFLRRSIEDLEGQLSRKQEAKDAVVGMATKDMQELRNQVKYLGKLLIKADKRVVNQSAKVRDQNNTIDRLKADQYAHRSTIDYLKSVIKIKNIKISRAKDLFKIILTYALPVGLRNSIKEEINDESS